MQAWAPGIEVEARYRLQRELGRGGLGVTWLAEDALLGRQVALKRLLQPSAERLGLLRAEFLALRGLSHPHLTRVDDFSAAGAFMASRFVDGLPLQRWAVQASWPEVCQVLRQVLEALALLHSVGFRHGDVKAENVLVQSTAGEAAGAPHSVLIDLSCAAMLGVGSEGVAGTPGSIAPEVLRGEAADERADFFSLGVLLRQLLEGRPEARAPAWQGLAARLTGETPAQRPAVAGEIMEALGGQAFAAVRRLAPPAQPVGRQALLQVLAQAWQQCASGDAGVRALWLEGEAGSGLSRLLQELKWQVSLQAPVLEALGEEPMLRLLQRAAGDDAWRGSVADLGVVRQRLAEQPPRLLLVDDAQRLQGADAELLDALWRSTQAEDRWLLVCAAHAPPPCMAEAQQVLHVAPLGEADVRAWLGGSPLAAQAREVWQWSGGLPAVLQVALQPGLPSSLALDNLRQRFAVALQPGAEVFEAESEICKRCLRRLAVAEQLVAEAELEAEGYDAALLHDLQQRGWLAGEEGGWRLRRLAATAVVEQGSATVDWRAAHQAAARAARRQAQQAGLGPARRHHLAALQAWHALQAGDVEAALHGMASAELSGATALWLRVAERVAAADARLESRMASASLLLAAGRADKALSWLARAWRQRPEVAEQLLLASMVVRCLLRLGDGKRATRWLQRLAGSTTPPIDLPAWQARATLLIGDAKAALQQAQQGLAHAALPPPQAAALHDAAGLACSYLGQPDAALQHLQQAAALHAQHSDAPAQIRSLSYAGFAAYRAGDAATAAQRYEQALRLADEQALADLMATGALNLASACHQQGDWGRAWQVYPQALQLGRALGREGTQRHAAFNLSKLCADLGAHERAASLLAQVQASTSKAEQRFFRWACLAQQAELRAAAGAEGDEVMAMLAQAQQGFAGEGAGREAAEVDLVAMELMHRLGWRGEVQAMVQRLAEADLPADLQVERMRLQGLAALVAGDSGRALGLLEEALRGADALQRRPLQARCHQALAKACEATQAQASAQQHTLAARALWERVAAGLPAQVRDAFWWHAERRALRVSAQPQPAEASAWQRLVAINRRLGASLKVDEVLHMTVDAALELTGGERGFVLLRRSSSGQASRRPEMLEVRVARGMDGEAEETSRAFSRSMAEQVMRTGVPLIATDAVHDGRFDDQASVHALRLQSVLVVPIVAAEVLMGALYVDSRLQRGRFSEADLPWVAAFADQAALALRNAHLHEQLQHRGEELAAEKRRVQGLLRSQNEQIDQLRTQLRWRERAQGYQHPELIGSSPAMQQVLATIERIADLNINVLLSGESGTGKELVARAIHQASQRRDKPFVPLNCAAVPETLLESELFGHVRGAFSGAERDRVGLVLQAQGGTLFLDELGEMPLAMQVKLLRLLQEREVRPLGSQKSQPVDVRLICATNRQLKDEVQAGRFREDLYYRVAVLELPLPPLRDRLADLPELAEHLLARAAKGFGKPKPRLTAGALRQLMQHQWPGNVRELDNTLSKALAFAEHEGLIDALDVAPTAPGGRSLDAPVKGRAAYASDEARQLEQALAAHRWNVSEVSRALQMPRATLYRKLHRYGLLERHKR